MNNNLLCYCVHSFFIPESLKQLPPGLLRAVDTLEDKLVKKTAQLIHDKIMKTLCHFAVRWTVESFSMGFKQAPLATDPWQLLLGSSVVPDG